MQIKIEVVPVPVTDVDRAKAFYVDRLGFGLDVDLQLAPGVRFVQVTPPASACSFILGTGLKGMEMAPGELHGVHLVVPDIESARTELLDRGVEVGDLEDVGGGVRYATVTDPDGNTLLLQEMSWRTGDRF